MCSNHTRNNSTFWITKVVLRLVGTFLLLNIAWFSITREFWQPEIPPKTNMVLANEGKLGVHSSDWLCGCMSIQLRPEAVSAV